MKLNIYIFFFLCCFSVNVGASSLYVYYPSEISAAVFQRSINSVCPNVDVTVFGRSKDFRQGLSNSLPDAILTLGKIIESTESFTPAIKGILNEKDSENYLLVSVDKRVSIEEVSKLDIGVIDILGRKPMNQFVSQNLGDGVKVKRVTKIEDLLPLLTFGAVDSILVRESVFNSLKAKSNLDLQTLVLNFNSALGVLAVRDGILNTDVQLCVQKFGSDLNSMFGVDKWRKL